jgi:uncharacterized protein (DUF1697 family)
MKMQNYVAILRGINVSGQKMVKMELLKKYIEEIGCKQVTTYIQSGNIIFGHENKNTPELTKLLEDKIQKEFGFHVPVIVKNADDLTKVLNNNPFVNLRHENIDYLHVTILASLPDATLLDKINTSSYMPDEFSVIDDVIYLFCPNGYGRTKLNNNFFENKLKLVATTRNWKTIIKLVELSH